MKLHAGQLSLLELDDPPPDETTPDAPKRSVRKRATRRDKSAEGTSHTDAGTTSESRTMPAATAPALLTTDEAADLLHVHPRTVQRLVERGQLCAVHLGCAVRFDPQDIAGLIERVKRGGRATPAASDPLPARRRGSVSFRPATVTTP